MLAIHCLFLCLTLLLLDGPLRISWGADPSDSGRQQLMEKYEQIERDRHYHSFGFLVESSVNKNGCDVELYGTTQHPFSRLSDELRSPDNLCHILLLHPNVRGCAYQKINGASVLTVHQVNKFDRPLKDAYIIKYKYQVIAQDSQLLSLLLSADRGPFQTKDHQFSLKAIPLGKDTTLIKIGYSFRYGPGSYLLIKSYFAVWGNRMIGFSKPARQSGPGNVYVRGLRGATERNIVRYYLAIIAYMDTVNDQEDQRFQDRINRWYDLTTRYKKQLYFADKDRYVALKRRDHDNHLKLQAEFGMIEGETAQ